MQKIFYLIYGVLAYVLALIGQLWFILYLGEWSFIPRSISDIQTESTLYALFVNLFLVLLFGLQHTLMARAWFKQWLTQYISSVIERSTYVLFSGIALLLFVLYWEPIDGMLWQVKEGIWHDILTVIYLAGWILSVIASFVINHFELFGLEQVYLHYRNKPTPTINFQERFFYKFVRHPIQFGVLIGIWFTPTMTYSHLTLSLLFTLYIFIGLHYEEKDLLHGLGEVYKDYKKRVGMLWPRR